MLSFRLLFVGATLLAVAAVSATIALNSRGNPGAVYAITPTLTKDQLAWSFGVEAPDQPVAGSTWQVTAHAVAGPPDVFPPGAISNVRYRLWTREPMFPGEVALEVVSAAEVAVGDMLDGAQWELRGAAPGQGQLYIEVNYRVDQCAECGSRGGNRYVGQRTVNVVALRGDVDCSAGSNSIDAVLVLQYVAELIDEMACYGGADVNSDSSIDAVDAMLILQHDAGLINEWPS